MKRIIDFLNELEKRSIYYRINKIRDSIMIEIAVPGQRWEVEFFNDEHIEIEKFVSSGEIYDENELEVLLLNYSD